LRVVRRQVTGQAAFPPERLRRAIAQTIAELRRFLVTRRRRANPRVVKRKMSNFGVKRAQHRAWPQPTKPVDQAVVIVGASKPARPRGEPESPAHQSCLPAPPALNALVLRLD
jgi:hypothetical protein